LAAERPVGRPEPSYRSTRPLYRLK
jgi:hypothetical protein